MTDAEIIRHLAGLKWDITEIGKYTDLPMLIGRDRESGECVTIRNSEGKYAWNPLESRDDCAEVEAAVPEGKRWDYVMELREMVDPNGDRPNARTCTALVYATTRQKCIAIVEATR